MGSRTLKAFNPDISPPSIPYFGAYFPAGKSLSVYELQAFATSTYFVAAVFMADAAKLIKKLLPALTEVL